MFNILNSVSGVRKKVCNFLEKKSKKVLTFLPECGIISVLKGADALDSTRGCGHGRIEAPELLPLRRNSSRERRRYRAEPHGAVYKCGPAADTRDDTRARWGAIGRAWTNARVSEGHAAGKPLKVR